MAGGQGFEPLQASNASQLPTPKDGRNKTKKRNKERITSYIKTPLR